ncbi:MAG TPA: hypothetical protein VKD72_08945 [Gemmataceae bacterium]|nr:hypothetical protein [Gemmataceae bacterium]
MLLTYGPVQFRASPARERLQEKNAAAYGEAITGKGLAYVLAYHQATHLAYHTGQIRSIRNLYRKTRGEPVRFFPDNPTFPDGDK